MTSTTNPPSRTGLAFMLAVASRGRLTQGEILALLQDEEFRTIAQELREFLETRYPRIAQVLLATPAGALLR